jgi:hypothetical protein
MEAGPGRRDPAAPPADPRPGRSSLACPTRAPDACIPALPRSQKDAADGALRLLEDNLNILVDLTGALDAGSSGYGDPFNPGG